MCSNRVQLVHDVSVGWLENAIDDVDDEVLEAVEELVVREERALGLDMRVPAGEPNRETCGGGECSRNASTSGEQWTVNSEHPAQHQQGRGQRAAIRYLSYHYSSCS